MARGVGHGHHAPEGETENRRLDDAQSVAKSGDVVAPLRQPPGFARSAGSAVAAVVDEDNLVGIGKAVKVGTHQRVIESRPSVKHQQAGSLGHARAVEGQLRAHHIKEDPRAVNVQEHDGPLRALGIDAPVRGFLEE
jgi:hypothetical protein